MTVQPRVERALSLGEAAATLPRKIASGERASPGKTVGEMNAEHDDWRDSQPIVTLCAFCEWTFEGTVLDGRMAALQHRIEEHPEATVRRARGRGRISNKRARTAGEQEQARVEAAEANRVRAEKEDAERLEKIERGRERRALAEAAADGESVDDEPAGADGAAAGKAAVSSNAREKPAQSAILAQLATGPRKLRDLAEERGRSVSSVSVHLNKLIGEGLVRKLGYGVYALADYVEPEEPERAARLAPAARQGNTAARSELSEREPEAAKEETPRHPTDGRTASAPGEESSRSEPSTEIELRKNAIRDPIRTAEIPYDADVLEDEAHFLRRRAGALEQIAGGIRQLAQLSQEKAA